jgi:hypothetical protein
MASNKAGMSLSIGSKTGSTGLKTKRLLGLQAKGPFY